MINQFLGCICNVNQIEKKIRISSASGIPDSSAIEFTFTKNKELVFNKNKATLGEILKGNKPLGGIVFNLLDLIGDKVIVEFVQRKKKLFIMKIVLRTETLNLRGDIFPTILTCQCESTLAT